MLECLLCKEKYDLLDVKKLRYFLDTRICGVCYRQGQKAPITVWCFGKPKAFSLKKVECSKLCPDRRICKLVIDKEK
jgi:hypothetical protein